MTPLFAALAPLAVAASTVPASESEISAPGPTGELKGILMAPASEMATVVLIIPGSGPTDHDGNSPLGVLAAPYKLIAEGLAERGIASVRIDKRGMFSSKTAVADPNAVTIADYAADTANWVTAIRQRTGVACVWVLGHSEGGLVALASINAKSEGICGVILVAAGGRPMGEVLREQLHANPFNAPLLPAADTAIDSLATGKHVDASSLPAPLMPLFSPKVQGFLISMFALDPAKLVATSPKPVTIVQGMRDIQVSLADAQRLKAASPTAKLVLLPDTNHVLKQVTSGDRAANAATYTDPALPLAPGVIDAVAGAITGI